MTNLIRIVAAIVDTSTLTLYKQDGSTVVIPQGDARVQKIITEASPQIIRNGFADVDLTTESTYTKFEKESKGSVSFFKIAKDKLKSFFGGAAAVQSAVVGKIPTKDEEQKTMAAVEEIMKHAIPVSSPEFTETNVDVQRNIVEENGVTPTDCKDVSTSTHTIVAITKDNQIVPGVEKIKTQFVHATKLGSTKGVEAFLARAGKVASQRSHSVEDLLKFMERGDLPIAEDGSILIYKVLNRKEDGFVDVHSGNVTQKVGDYVCMDESLVDHNRNNECSNGLHVARRGYVKSFNGSACTLCKVAPEDVIAVPAYDANKMRVCGYHIIAELTQEMFALVNKNQPISDCKEGAQLLANALAGKHVSKLREVRITGHKGAGLQFKELQAETKVTKQVPVKAPVKALNNPKQMQEAPVVDPKKVIKQVKKVSKTMKPVIPTKKVSSAANGLGSPRERIQKLLEIGITSQGVAGSILKLKKDAKKGWSALGVSDAQVAEIMRIAGYGPV